MLELLNLSLSPMALLGAAAATLLAGFIRAYAGFGFALAGVPLLANLMPPAQAVPLVLILEMFSGAQLVPTIWHEVDWSALKLLLIAALVTTPMGVWLLAVVPEDTMRLIMSVIVLVAAAILGSGWRAPGSGGSKMALSMGAIAGILNGSSAMCGPPVLFYFLARGIPAVNTRASMLMFFLMVGFLALMSSVVGGLVGSETLVITAVCLPALIASTIVGRRMFRRSRDGTYRTVAIGLLGVIGVATLIRTLLGG